MRKYRVIALCGSTKFEDEFIRIQKELTLEGNLVMKLNLFENSRNDSIFENMSEDKITKIQQIIINMNRQLIDMSDAIFVINPDEYVEICTRDQILYAFDRNKDVLSIKPINMKRIFNLSSHS